MIFSQHIAQQASHERVMLRISASALNRGAQVTELSQYPEEVQQIWAPLSFMEPDGALIEEQYNDAAAADGPRTAGTLMIVPVRELTPACV